mmetsp:Transcript_57956/g.96112  ORF Transcript_57956/g.96112 Transcript_57956/m.96112 type:complete len:577 (+) Transcript_57956:38-1768(+)
MVFVRLVLLCACTAARVVQGVDVCYSPGSLDWQSYDNELKLNGNRFDLKGLSWFGFETTNYNLYGLDKHSVDWYLDWIKAQGFNAMRLPFSQDFIQNGDKAAYLSVVQKAADRGILVMPDFHSKSAGAYTEGLSAISEGGAYGTAIATWVAVADLLKDEWNVFAGDCYNEPHDVSNAGWPTFVSFCEKVATAIWARGVSWLIVVEGTNYDCMSLGADINCAWGENLMGIRASSRSLTVGTNKVVWSPHVYGEEITSNAWSSIAWQQHWGYLVDGSYAANVADVVIGEFGTRFDSSAQQEWLTGLVNYLISIDARNTFFWCLNPNSGDTGGLLNDDWTTARDDKLALLNTLQPNPTAISYNAATEIVCVSTSSTSGTTTSSTTTSTTSSSAGGNSGGYIQIQNDNANQQWYLSINLLNVDGSACGEAVTSVSIYYNNAWVAAAQNFGDRYAWNNFGFSFKDMLPISLQITTSQRTLTLWSIITAIDKSSIFTASETICDLSSAHQAAEESQNTAGTSTKVVIIAVCAVVALLMVLSVGAFYIVHVNRKKTKQMEKVADDAFENSDDDRPATSETVHG